MRICAVLAEAVRALQHSTDTRPVVVSLIVAVGDDEVYIITMDAEVVRPWKLVVSLTLSPSLDRGAELAPPLTPSNLPELPSTS